MPYPALVLTIILRASSIIFFSCTAKRAGLRVPGRFMTGMMYECPSVM